MVTSDFTYVIDVIGVSGMIGVIGVIDVIPFFKGPPFLLLKKSKRKKITYRIMWLMWLTWLTFWCIWLNGNVWFYLRDWHDWCDWRDWCDWCDWRDRVFEASDKMVPSDFTYVISVIGVIDVIGVIQFCKCPPFLLLIFWLNGFFFKEERGGPYIT